jgi:hypothetical protein
MTGGGRARRTSKQSAIETCALSKRLGSASARTTPLDEKRLYVSGFSNGAGFSYLLWAQTGKAIAALAECAGRRWIQTELTAPSTAARDCGGSGLRQPLQRPGGHHQRGAPLEPERPLASPAGSPTRTVP